MANGAKPSKLMLFTQRCSRGRGGSMCPLHNSHSRLLPHHERAMFFATPPRHLLFATPIANSSSPSIGPLRLLCTLTRDSENWLHATGRVTACVERMESPGLTNSTTIFFRAPLRCSPSRPLPTSHLGI